MCQLDDGPHDGIVVAAGAQHASNGAVELEHVGLARAQRGERGDAGAEVVECDLHAEAAQRLHRAQVARLAIVERVLVEVERQLGINEDVLRWLTVKVEELDLELSPLLARRERERERDRERTPREDADVAA